MGEKTEAQKRAQEKYMEKFMVARVRMGRDRYEAIQGHADARGESVNGFINRAISGDYGAGRRGFCGLWGSRMSQNEKLLLSIMSGTKDKSILFADLCTVLDRLGFSSA